MSNTTTGATIYKYTAAYKILGNKEAGTCSHTWTESHLAADHEILPLAAERIKRHLRSQLLWRYIHVISVTVDKVMEGYKHVEAAAEPERWPGLYWVKLKGGDCWTVGLLHDDDKFPWKTLATLDWHQEEDFSDIGPRIPEDGRIVFPNNNPKSE